MATAPKVPTFDDLNALRTGAYGDESDARIEPFADVPLDVASWWV